MNFTFHNLNNFSDIYSWKSRRDQDISEWFWKSFPNIDDVRKTDINTQRNDKTHHKWVDNSDSTQVYKLAQHCKEFLKQVIGYDDRKNYNEGNQHDYNNNQYKLHNHHDSGSVLRYIGIFGFVIVVYVIVKFCCEYKNKSPRNDAMLPNDTTNTDAVAIYRRSPSVTRIARETCSHNYCSLIRSANPFARCAFAENNVSSESFLDQNNIIINNRIHIPLHAEFAQNSRSGSLENLNVIGRTTNNEYHLDLPPTYAQSTENSSTGSKQNLHKINSNADCGLPPSYQEALAATFTGRTTNWENSASNTAYSFRDGRGSGDGRRGGYSVEGGDTSD